MYAEPHLRRALHAANVGSWEYDPAARAAKADAQTSALFRLEPMDTGWAPLDQFAMAIHQEDVDLVIGQLETRKPFEAVFRIANESGGVRWLRSVGEWGAEGTQERLFGLTFDFTKERDRELELELLIGEMRHRVGNAFSIISGLIGLEARASDGDANALAAALRARLGAMARAQTLSFNENPFGEGLSLGDLVEAIGQPFLPANFDRLDVVGGETTLSDEARSVLSLVFYEWFTNALKYGALSTPDGRIAVAVERSGDGLELVWRERDGPAPEEKAEREGFGERLCAAMLMKIGRAPVSEFGAEGLTIRAALDPRHFPQTAARAE
ncbi:MAG: HWE histidine kinase domain-containing protein [Pseudomonadota bacterium]